VLREVVVALRASVPDLPIHIHIAEQRREWRIASRLAARGQLSC